MVALWALGLFAVGVTSTDVLKLSAVDGDAAVAEWTALHVPAKGRKGPVPKVLQSPLHFELTDLQIPNVSAFGPILAAYLQREMDRGWLVQGSFGAVEKNAPRTAVFTRSHPKMALDWGMPGRATPVGCAPVASLKPQPLVGEKSVNTLGWKVPPKEARCYLVVPEDKSGAAFIELGGRLGQLRVFPRVLVVMAPEGKDRWMAQAHILVILKAEDAEKLKVPAGELGDPMRATLSAILGGLRVAPTVDANKDGVGDAWRFEAGATFAVTPKAP